MMRNFCVWVSVATLNNNIDNKKIFVNDTLREKLRFTQFIVQEFIETESWIFLTFLICFHNQLSSRHSMVTYY